MIDPDIQPPVPALGQPAIDLTDPSLVGSRCFHVNDRVERLSGRSEQSRWGTITAAAAADQSGEDWLVRDNAGEIHRDQAVDLSLAVRSGEGLGFFGTV